MAEAVWETLKRYKIEDRIMAIMADNASNNDTMIDEIVALAREDEKAIELNAQWIRMRCMPHTVHLAALKVCSSIPLPASINVFFFQLLEGVGAISAAEGRKAGSRSGYYQAAVAEPLRSDGEENPETVGDEDEQDSSENIFSSVEKARTTFRPNIPLTSHHSFEKLFARYDQAPSAKGTGSIK